MRFPAIPISRMLRLLVALNLCWAAAGLLADDGERSEPSAADREFFEKEVRPLLVMQCYKCHSAGEKKRGGLLLDSREGALEGGDNGPALEPGKPDESRLVQAIRYTDSDLKMPPKGKLTDAEIAVLTKWVERGAPWPNSQPKPAGGAPLALFDLHERAKHWSFQPVRPAAVPQVQRADWAQSPIDCFILAGLERAGLTPAEPADKPALLRRVTFDLTGLPPTVAELQAFLADDSPLAFEWVVDRLLASPRYGERWGRHWLDLVRFAETGGHEFDFEIPNAFRYRDYVIRALNDDVPYDQFVREHVAGDLLPEPRRHPVERFNESVLGTGFFWLGEAKHSPVDVRAEEAARVDNQIDVFAKTFLGLTVSCARCHDHKFDAISTRDYYALAGFLQSSRYEQAFIDDPAPTQRITARLRELQQARVQLLEKPAQAARAEQLSGLARYLDATAEVFQLAAGTPPAAVADRLEADRLPIAEVTGGEAAPQAGLPEEGASKWTGGTHLFWRGANPGARLTLNLDFKSEGAFTIQAAWTKARDYGTVQLSLDGRPLGGPVDLYSPEALSTGPVTLGVAQLAAGTHRLMLEITGKNALSVGHQVGLDYLRLKRAPDEPDISFADFDGPDYAGWTATGDAFGEQPNRLPLPGYQGAVAELGAGFVNSHSRLVAGERQAGDDLTGTLTSPKFRIDRGSIRFLIGGGSHAGKTCLNLYVAGKLHRTATGRNANRMDWAQFDVRDALGQHAYLEIVDNEKGGWGNIGVDQIVFTNDTEEDPRQQAIAAIAQREQLDAAFLGRWVDELTSEAVRTNPSHVVYAVAELLKPDVPAEGEEFAKARLALIERLREPAPEQRGDESTLEDFAQPTYADWFTSGEAFGSGPTSVPDVIEDALVGHAKPAVTAAGVAHSGRVSGRLQGAVRSQTFTIETDRIWYRAAGTGRISLIIDEFHQIRAPIYGGLTMSPADQERFTWQVQDVSMWRGHRAYIEIADEGDGAIAVDRIVCSNGGPPAETANPAVLKLLARPDITTRSDLTRKFAELARSALNAGTAAEIDAGEILGWLLRPNSFGSVDEAAGLSEDVRAQLAALGEQRAELDAQIPAPRRAPALTEGTPENEHVFIRGNHKSLGDEVPRRLLEALGGTDSAPAEGSGRLELAERMLADTNPLLPRVIVNRLWQHHFGEGLVRSPDDFGLMGQPPTHPELLDYLARELVRDGWSLKRMHRRMLLTSTYRMASRANPAAAGPDPQNRLLHRMPVRRLEAEAIRDGLLAVGGRLDETMYGPGVRPYLTPFMLGRGRPAESGALDGDGRRSIYINVRRNFLSPMFLAFDYPIPFTTIGLRTRSNVPAQALSLMNNPFVVQQSERWAQRVLAEELGTPGERVTRMYLTAFSRPPTGEELDAATTFVRTQSELYGKPDAPDAWRDLCHVLINTKEFIFID